MVSDIASEESAEEEDGVTYLTAILWQPRRTEIKHEECKICRNTSSLLFVLTIPYFPTYLLIHYTFVLGKSFVLLACCLLKLISNGSGIALMKQLRSSTPIVIPIQGQWVMEQQKASALNWLFWHRMAFCMHPLPLSQTHSFCLFPVPLRRNLLVLEEIQPQGRAFTMEQFGVEPKPSFIRRKRLTWSQIPRHSSHSLSEESTFSFG